MIRTRLIAPLVLTIALVCSIYWLSGATTPVFATIHQSLRSTILGDHRRYIPGNEQAAGYAQHHTSQSISTPYGVIPDSEDAERYQSPDASQPFPRHIWQSSSIAGKEKYSKQIQTWKDNTDYDYHWLSDADADTFVYNAFSQSQPSLVAFWNDLSTKIHAEASTITTESIPNHTANTSANQIVVNSTSSSSIVLRADLLRYMLMSVHGGIYTDIDTSVLVPISHWLPQHLTSRPQPHPTNAVIGIEYDDTKLAMFVRPISFCQWTLMSKPNHPIFTRAIQRVISNLEFLARRQRV